ncbi:lysophospholipid acyltransferase family protein [Caulobacter sp. RL271]|uniref:Lysophospholipid acyltransferase family protein n=1 Tax=Caulobacter segnis TaxID=88688 RepID=A0ABY4ZS37_9CAUL|nr:lysophospholipid acyltransferase family protein [Caulobacter segnis]USQ95618.1 lysophospholipid acyltransferase family protein [Caulobacter segnis]
MRPLRSPFVIWLLSSIFAGYSKLVFRTLRMTVEGAEQAEAVWKQGRETGAGAILCFWHSRIPMSPLSWPQDLARRQDMRALISRSNDGEFIARTVEKLGFPSIRGSSAKKTDLTKNKHGEQAFRDMVQWVRSGGGIAITPDGPRGPAEHMEKGTPSLARVTGAPVIFVGLAAKPCIRLGSWDATLVPLPFARAAMVWDGPTGAGRGDDVDQLAEDWADRLSAVTRRAEDLVGLDD